MTGDPATGRGPANDWFGLVVRGIAALGAVPCLDDVPKAVTFDVTPVDFAAAATIQLALHAAPASGLARFHLAGAGTVTLAALVEALRRAGRVVDEIPRARWMERAACSAAGDVNTAVARLGLSRVLDPGGHQGFARHRALDLFQATGAMFDRRRAQAALAEAAIVCRPPDQALLDVYVRAALAGDCEIA